MDAVFVKTVRGLAELGLRSGALTPRARRVLILVDGRRTVSELDALIQSDSLRNILGQLEEDGYIELAEAKASAPPVAAPPDSPFGTLPQPADPKRLRQARSIMSEAIHSFVGDFAAKGLLRQLAAAQSQQDLRALYGDWIEILSNSLASPWEVSDLRDKLLRVI